MTEKIAEVGEITSTVYGFEGLFTMAKIMVIPVNKNLCPD